MKRFLLPALYLCLLIHPRAGAAFDDAVIAPDSNPVALSAVEKKISFFSNDIRDRFALYLSRSGKYLGLMKDILRENGLPEDMVFLALIESGFNPYAYSRSKAAGPWQFISSTAKRYGLKIDWWVDERRDPVKSTQAAASYLKDLYEIFGSWHLAMAAYNAGEGRILRALRKLKADDFWDLTTTKYIRNETKDYVPKFIAARKIASDPEDYGFSEIEYEQNFRFDEVTLESPADLEVIALCAETSLEEIKALNPELSRWCTPPNVHAYTIRIPEGGAERFMERLNSIPEEKRFSMKLYTIKKGDTLYKIAKKTGTPLDLMLSLNSLTKKSRLKTGRTLYLPAKGDIKLTAPDIEKLIEKIKDAGLEDSPLNTPKS
jgi:membrane-bound lytic murein transglycosylase D